MKFLNFSIIKLKNKIKFLARRITTRNIDVSKLKFNEIIVPENDVNYSSVSCSLIVKIHQPNGDLYFRECTKISHINQYIDSCIERFFYILKHSRQEGDFGSPKNGCVNTNYSTEIIDSFHNLILESQSSPTFYTKIKRIPDYCSLENLSFYRNANKFFSHKTWQTLGIFNYESKYDHIAKFFALYLNRCLILFFNNIGKTHDFFSASAFFATATLNDYFNLNLVSKPRFAKLKSGPFNCIGFVCDDCHFKFDSELKYDVTPKLQHELNNLHILDILCYQLDHGPNNFSVILENDKISGICAFDNDATNTFSIKTNINFSASWNASSLVLNGIYNRPFLDKNIYNLFIKTNKKDLKKILAPYLSALQIYALQIRFNKLKKSMIKAVKLKKTVLLSDNEWNEKTLEKELEGLYGRTYTYIYKTRDIG